MGMSKKKFSLLLLGLVLLLGGGIAVVIIFRSKNLGETEPKMKSVSDDPAAKGELGEMRNGKAGALRGNGECQKWVRNPKKQIEFKAKFTHSRIATRETVNSKTKEKIVRNAYWLTGSRSVDAESLRGIKLQACLGKIPVVVVRMRPVEGIQMTFVHSNWDYYKPKSAIKTWKDYDEQLRKYINALKNIPAIIILEPDLLMFTYDLKNHQHRWLNEKYENEFLVRAQRVITKLDRARVYVDAGNAAHLAQSLTNLDQMAKTLLRLHGLRGFSINALHFVNQTYNEYIARRLYCRTGLHYLVDTSRNGGAFSKQPLPAVEKCLFDPPNMKNGQFPGWAWGSNRPISAPRLKRWINQIGSSSSRLHEESKKSNSPQPRPTARIISRATPSTKSVNRNDPNWEVNEFNNRINNKNNNPESAINNKNNGADSGASRGQEQQRRLPSSSTSTEKPSKQNTESGGSIRSVKVATEYLRSFKSNLRRCVSRKSNVIAHDANVWLKTAGESDGRLYRFGTYRACLVNHDIPCDDSCKQYVQLDAGRRSPSCQCSSSPFRHSPSKVQSFPVNNFPLD